MDLYVRTCKKSDECIFHFNGQNGLKFCEQQFCQCELRTFMWYWSPIWASNLATIVGRSE